MRVCCRCKIREAIVNKNRWCRECKRDYDRDYWSKTKSIRNERKKENSNKIKIRNRQFLWNYLLLHPCVDCGNSNPIVLQFDHIDKKLLNIKNFA